MRPGVRADGVACGGDLLENFRMIGRVLADREEHRLGAFVGQRLQHRRRGRPRTVVEGQHDLLVGQEVELLVLQEAETRSARGVDHDGAADAERIGIGAGRFCRRRRGAGGGAGFDSEAVTSTSSLRGLAAGPATARPCGRQLFGEAASARGEEVQNQTPAITTAATTLASIRPNALRIATLSNYARAHTRRGH